MRNLLTVISYVPVLRDSLLDLAIHRMIKIDVCVRGVSASWLTLVGVVCARSYIRAHYV